MNIYDFPGRISFKLDLDLKGGSMVLKQYVCAYLEKCRIIDFGGIGLYLKGYSFDSDLIKTHF